MNGTIVWEDPPERVIHERVSDTPDYTALLSQLARWPCLWGRIHRFSSPELAERARNALDHEFSETYLFVSRGCDLYGMCTPTGAGGAS